MESGKLQLHILIPLATLMEDLSLEPIKGSHFFQNLTSFEVGYFTAHKGNASSRVDCYWMLAQAHEDEMESLRHVRIERPLWVDLDGRNGRVGRCGLESTRVDSRH